MAVAVETVPIKSNTVAGPQFSDLSWSTPKPIVKGPATIAKVCRAQYFCSMAVSLFNAASSMRASVSSLDNAVFLFSIALKRIVRSFTHLLKIWSSTLNPIRRRSSWLIRSNSAGNELSLMPSEVASTRLSSRRSPRAAPWSLGARSGSVAGWVSVASSLDGGGLAMFGMVVSPVSSFGSGRGCDSVSWITADWQSGFVW